jgi:hypothetical protein
MTTPRHEIHGVKEVHGVNPTAIRPGGHEAPPGLNAIIHTVFSSAPEGLPGLLAD